MKNLKKVLALVVALTMVLGTVAFADYTDVAVDADEYTAVSTLSSLGILTGYEDGSFKPEGDITRAEFCAVVCRALGAKVAGSAVTAFTDVPADHWASAYIAYVAGQGIVNGMGDGTFAPNANVTFEQAVKMLVVALGYEPVAASRGGYPTGYMVVANTYGLTEGISAVQDAPASRGIVAQLVANALDIPVMEQVGFGTQISYEIMSPEYDNAYKALITGLGVAKLDGSVIATDVIGGQESGYVTYHVAEANDNKYFEEKLDAGTTDFTLKIGEGVNANDFFAYASTVYAKEYSKNKYEIIAIMPGAESTVVNLSAADIEAISATEVEYYTDADKYNTKKYKLDSAVVYYNYGASNVNAVNTRVGLGGDVEIELIDNDADNKFEFVIAKEYSYDRVDSVEAARSRFIGQANTFVFDFEDDTKVITIVDKDGNEIGLDAFAEDDVIAYISNGSTRNYDWIEVINLGKSSVEGTVNESDADVIYVDGVEYGKAGVGTIKLGDEGVFYLTRTGKIFDFDKAASVAGNYAYILGTAISNNGGWDNAWQVKMLTKDNEIVTYTVKDGFTVNNDENIDQDATSAGIISDLAIDLNANSAADAFKTVNVAKRVVTYKLDSNGLIREIANPTVSSQRNGDYNADAEKLFTAFESDAVIFNLTSLRETGAFVTDASSLVDENNYTGYYVTNEDSEVDCLIITAGAAAIDYTQDLAIVTAVTTTKVNEEDAKKVRYYVSAEDAVKEIIIMDDVNVSTPIDGTNKADVKVGAIMMFTADADNVVSAYAVLANTAFAAASNSAAASFNANSTLVTAINSDANLDTQVVTGYIADTAKVSKGTKVVAGDANEYVILGTTNTYTVRNDAEAKARVYAGDWQATADVDTAIGHDNGKANYFIAKIVDDKVADFIVFTTPRAY